jgi:hypothetical protein
VDRREGDLTLTPRPPRPRHRHLATAARRTIFTVGLALPASSATLAAQERLYLPEERRWLDAGAQEDVAFTAANALLSGVAAGLFRSLSGSGTFGDGFRDGAMGGGVTYAGKRLAAQRFAGAGALGRQVASIGGSVVANAADGRGRLDRVALQLGLGRLYWDRVESSLTFKPDAVTLYYTALGLSSSRVSLDWSRTLSAGAPVFVTRGGATTLSGNAAGRALGGVVIADVNANIPLSDITAHERIHVIQFDQHYALWGEAVERAGASLLGARLSRMLGRVDLGITTAPFVPLFDLIPRGSNPAEVEADYLTVR